MPRAFLIAAVVIAVPSLAIAQDEDIVLPQRHNVYLEIGGNASRYSMNYERTLAEHHRLRFGFAIWTGGETTAITETEMMIPVMYNVLAGSGPHYIEMGAGVLVGVINEDRASGNLNGTFWSATGTIGYRHQLPSLEWFFRVGFTPIYGFGNDDLAYPQKGFAPKIGFSIGRAFN